MKLERESVFGHISPGHKPDSKPFDYNNISLDSTGLKSQSITKEGQNGTLCDFKDNEKDAAQLIYLMNDEDRLAASKVDCFKNEYEVEEFVAPFTKSSLEIQKGSNYYTDKSVMECELPELQVCYKESSFSSVKDICIDEGVPSQDKFLFGNGENKKDLCTFVFPDADENEQLSKEHMDIGIPSSTALKSSVKNQSEKESVDDCESKDLILRGEVKCDSTCEIGNEVPSDKIFPENVIMMRELCIENLHSKASSCDDIASVQVQTSSDNASETTQMVSMSSAMLAEKLNNSTEEELEIPSSVSAAEELSSSSSLDNQLSNDSKEEKGNRTGDFESLVPATVTKEECSHNGTSECLEIEDSSPVDDPVVSNEVQHNHSSVIVTREEDLQNGVCGGNEAPNTMVEVEDGTSAMRAQQDLAREECSHQGVSGCDETPDTSSADERTSETQNVSSPVEHVIDKEESPRNSDAHQSRDMPMFEDGTFGAHTVSGQFHYSHGESSFSAAGPMSGRINYSGPIPYSGSVSLRSDSSTTSTRSFAFPVLQSEWNSSPVRMAKAERRRFRKDKGWRQGLLCCRF